MRAVIGSAVISAVLFSGGFTKAFAGDEHDHDHHEDEVGLVIEGDECVGFLGREGNPGPFELDSEELILSGKVAACNLCLQLEEPKEVCLEADSRGDLLESRLSGGIEGGMSLKPGRREGAKVKFEFADGSKETFVCHFHSYESGEIDCH